VRAEHLFCSRVKGGWVGGWGRASKQGKVGQNVCAAEQFLAG
jgi:hypothetical protein